MNSAEKEAVLHCLKSMIDEEVCEECPLYGTTGTDHCEKDCVRLAINVLEQQPCDDAISRTAALNTLDTMDKALDENRTVEEYKELLRECYEQLPSVSTEKTGRWIDTGSGQECSECGEIQYGYDSFRKYCPNCGARMVEPQESEDKE